MDLIEIMLPDHENNLDVCDCFACDGAMNSVVITNTYDYKNRKVRVSNINARKCSKCGEEIYTSIEVDMILAAVRKVVDA